jgi:hypothetical protein
MRETLGVFPSLMAPARKAAEQITPGSEPFLPVPGMPGFWVALEESAEGADIFFKFEHAGRRFVILSMGGKPPA